MMSHDPLIWFNRPYSIGIYEENNRVIRLQSKENTQLLNNHSLKSFSLDASEVDLCLR